MNQTSSLLSGGVIFQKADIENILNDSNLVGVAFAVRNPGEAPNVDIDVIKVSEDNGLKGEIYPIPAERKGAAISNFHYPAGSVTEYKFGYLENLMEDGYYFGFLNRANLLSLFSSEPNWEEVFVGGGRHFYPDYTVHDQKPDWFDFLVALRRRIPTVVYDENKVNANNTITFPSLNSGVIFISDLVELDSSLTSIVEEEVSRVFLKDDGSVKGLLFANGTVGLFDNSNTIHSVKIGQETRLDAIQVTDIGIEAIELVSSQETIDLGDRLPYFRWSIGCPPRWPLGVTEEEANSNKYMRKPVDFAYGRKNEVSTSN